MRATGLRSNSVGQSNRPQLDASHLDYGQSSSTIGLGITSDVDRIARWSTAAAAGRRARLQPRKYKGLRDWLRRARRRDSLRLPAIVTGLVTTLAVTFWLSFSGGRQPSTVWISECASIHCSHYLGIHMIDSHPP